MKLNEVYLSYIRSKPCAVCGKMGVHPHHMEARGMGGNNLSGEKDYFCVPLCAEHHTEVGWSYEDFRTNYGVDLWKDVAHLQREFFLPIINNAGESK